MVKLNSLSFSINIPKPKKNKDVNTIKIVAKDIMGKVFIDKNLENFPRKDIEIKNRMRNISYDLLEISYMANVKKINKEIYMEQIIVKVKVLDFLLNLCYDKQIINYKRYVKFGEKLDDIMKYTIGWKNSIN